MSTLPRGRPRETSPPLQLEVPLLRRSAAVLARPGPDACDAALGGLGRLAAALAPEAAGARRRPRPRPGGPRRRLGRPRPSARPSRPTRCGSWPAITRSTRQPDAAVLARFDVQGFEARPRRACERGRGAILVGSHLGATSRALHWLYRRGVPLRLLVQRPRHVSAELNRRFDRADGPHPQSGFFLRRDLSAGQCVERLLRAGRRLRDGLAVYLNGDIPWTGPNTRPGRLLGQPRRVPVGLGRPGRPDPRPGLPRLLHPPPRRPVSPDDRARSDPDSPATSRGRRPLPLPPRSRDRRPPRRRRRPPALALLRPPRPRRLAPRAPAPAAASPPSPSPDPRARCGCPAWTSSVGWAPSIID